MCACKCVCVRVRLCVILNILFDIFNYVKLWTASRFFTPCVLLVCSGRSILLLFCLRFCSCVRDFRPPECSIWIRVCMRCVHFACILEKWRRGFTSCAFYGQDPVHPITRLSWGEHAQFGWAACFGECQESAQNVTRFTCMQHRFQQIKGDVDDLLTIRWYATSSCTQAAILPLLRPTRWQSGLPERALCV